ncbi:flagellin [Limnohabitans sp.]|uniref:flagellin N-terminal helical domain-containing protein n=1 Tax=Limnohabitans sp. TaxID=1907725 RepID=UPI00286EF758|nr:flagellin [Limnohabitans sp.]
MAVINTNVKALFSQMALGTSGRAQSVAMQQLSTGKRINSARDDAAGMAIATRMTQQIRSLNQAVRNAGDAVTLIQTAEGATNEITDMMQRMRELAIQAVNDTNDNAQRSYLDLEFQQLKQQIVQIADNTEWNGFPVLNGTAGERVGEMPVFKATSKNQFGGVFIDPTTTRTINGAGSGEVQTLTLAPVSPATVPSEGIVSVAGVSVQITATEAAAGMATVMNKIKSTLTDSTFFNANSGRKVELTGTTGELKITYNNTDGDVPDTAITLGSSNMSATTPVVARKAMTSATEVFANNGKFLQSGALKMSVNSVNTNVTASFVTQDNKTILLTGTLTAASGVVTFAKTAGLNSSVLSDDLSYTFRDPSGTALNLTTTPRDLSVNVDVAGSIPTLRAGDLMINGVTIGPSVAADDMQSPRNNAAGSAIAKAAAINRVAVDQGISQGESQSITFSGTPMPGTITVAGVSVVLTNADKTPADAAEKIATALQASPLFDQSTGRLVTYAKGSGVVNIDFPTSEGNVSALEVAPGATGLASTVNTTAQYLTSVPGTGVFAKVNENVFTGKAMTGSSVTSGVVFVNGYASANITTVLNNPQATREAVARAINLISDKTGVKAIDTGSEAKGISLVAVDGRNIEVRFETPDNASVFGDRIGMREGVQSSTISLESKIQAPVMLTSASSGDITRAGLDAGNYSKNESVLNTAARAAVAPATAQVSSVEFTGTVASGDTATIVINGTSFISTATLTKPQAVRDDLVTQINTNKNLGVIATAGNKSGEILLTAKTPGVSYTMTTTKSASATAMGVAAKEITPNAVADVKNLGMDDLMINGVKVRPSTPNDDRFSNTVVTSSDPGSSAIALAAAINDSTNLTGVRAEANPVVSKGINTVTGVPLSGKQSLWVNGTEIQVDFVQNESGTDRRTKVMDAINQRVGQHGVTATDNGYGVTLSSDGRNMSVWFDSSKDDLSAANFGLDKGGAVAQVSKVKVGGTTAAADTQTVMINGVSVSAAGGTTPVLSAVALKDAINANADLKNVLASIDPADTTSVLITSTVAGSGFDVRGAKLSAASAETLTISTVTANSAGKTDVTAIDLSTAYSDNVLAGESNAKNVSTMYGTVKLIADAPVLPGLPGADGIKPNQLGLSGSAIVISSGADGFGALSNFSTLGFHEGTFGGRASQEMDPPKVGRMAFQVGASANQVVTIDLADFGKNGSITGQITGDVDLAEDARKVRINTRDGATAVLNLLDAAMDKVNATRATMGAVMNRLDHVVNNLTNVSMNMSTSRSQIEDADYASASTELAKTQIMQQAATAVLAQANTSQQSVLKLLGG